MKAKASGLDTRNAVGLDVFFFDVKNLQVASYTPVWVVNWGGSHDISIIVHLDAHQIVEFRFAWNLSGGASFQIQDENGSIAQIGDKNAVPEIFEKHAFGSGNLDGTVDLVREIQFSVKNKKL